MKKSNVEILLNEKYPSAMKAEGVHLRVDDNQISLLNNTAILGPVDIKISFNFKGKYYESMEAFAKALKTGSNFDLSPEIFNQQQKQGAVYLMAKDGQINLINNNPENSVNNADLGSVYVKIDIGFEGKNYKSMEAFAKALKTERNFDLMDSPQKSGASDLKDAQKNRWVRAAVNSKGSSSTAGQDRPPENLNNEGGGLSKN